jgi:hypothetical protein
MMSGRKDFDRPSLREYLAIAIVVAAGVVLVGWASTLAPTPAESREIVAPMTAMFALTGAVWLLMVISRNVAVLLGAASVKYFRDYGDGAPDEWIERPARAFDNLMQASMSWRSSRSLFTVSTPPKSLLHGSMWRAEPFTRRSTSSSITYRFVSRPMP